MINKDQTRKKAAPDSDSCLPDYTEKFQLNEYKRVIIGPSAKMRSLIEMVKRIAVTDFPILITGPTGSGKEEIANLLHHFCKFPKEPFIDVNCGSIPGSLIESELFGHEKGAFTGATNRHKGYFSLVGYGSLFLDEIAELPMSQQAKLLRVIETRKFRPVGSERQEVFKGRIIAATHSDLEQRVKDNHFREDLYHRLNVFKLEIPGLEDRCEDIPALVESFCSNQKQPFGFTRAAIEKLKQVRWPGNVRQLKNTIDRIAVLCDENPVSEDVLEEYISDKKEESFKILDSVTKNVLNLDFKNKLSAVEFNLINKAMAESGGNKSEAARKLGVHRKFIERRLKVFDSDINQIYELSIKGEKAMTSSQYQDAAGHFQKAIEFLNKYPCSHKLEEIKLDMLLRLCVCLRTIHGWNHPQVTSIYKEAKVTGKSINKIDSLSTVSFGDWVDLLVKLDLLKALDAARDFLAAGDVAKSPYIRSQAFLALANTYFWLAEHQQAGQNLGKFVSLYDEGNEFILDYGHDPYVLYLMIQSLVSFQVGDFKKSRVALSQLQTHAKNIDHSFSTAIALQAGAWVEYLYGNHEKCYQFAEKLVSLSSEKSFPFYLGIGLIFVGFYIATTQDQERGIDLIEKGYNTMHRDGGIVFHSMYALVLGNIYYQIKEHKKGFEIVNKGIAVCKKQHELCYLSNLICLRGKFNLNIKKTDLAEADFFNANEIAIKQGALSSELHASLNLSNLQFNNGKHQDAVDTLSSVIAKFPVETDFEDFQRAVDRFKNMSASIVT